MLKIKTHYLSEPHLSTLISYLYLKRLPLKNRLLLETVRTWLDFSNLQAFKKKMRGWRKGKITHSYFMMKYNFHTMETY